MNEKIAEIMTRMHRAGHICNEHTATVLYLAESMQKPVLIEGPAGVGKTSVAQSFSRARGFPLIRLQCYEGIDEARALYEWNYKKQLLHIQAAAQQAVPLEEMEREIFSGEYLLKRPLLQAISSPGRVVLLIDEIDKVDFEFEAMLLELLSEFQVTLPEIGTVSARTVPCVFLTSNGTRELSEALKRRCLFLPLSFPGPEMERRILSLQVPGIDERLRDRLADALQKIRRLELKKPPSIAEGIDWARALIWLGRDDLDAETFRETAGVIMKYGDDLEKLVLLSGWDENGDLTVKSEQGRGRNLW